MVSREKELKSALEETRDRLESSRCCYCDVSTIETVQRVVSIVVCLGARQCGES